jgi:LysR family glycine cleavage system transcriptional activator
VRQLPSEPALPPLNALRAFEAAGRLQSIRKAAALLDVTPGAVSRQVRLLESWLGVPLFRREPHSVTLTPAGAQYLAAATTHLRAIAYATDQVAAGRPSSRLKVRTWTLFANWLVPRLADFRRRNPLIDLQLVASSQRADFAQPDADVEIGGYDTWDVDQHLEHEGDGDPLGNPSYESVLVVRSQLVCLCSRAYRDENELQRPEDLKRLGESELLHSLTAPDLWDRWLHAAGVGGLDSKRGQAYGDSALTAAAARAGHGVAILPRVVFEADIAAGQLVAPFRCEQIVCGFNFYLMARPERMQRPPVRTFRDWLLAQAAAK